MTTRRLDIGRATRLASPARAVVCGCVDWGADRAEAALVRRELDLLLDRRRRRGGSFRVLTGTAEGADAIARTWAVDAGVQLFAEDLEHGDYPTPMHRYNERLLAFDPDVVLAFKSDFDEAWADDEAVAGTEHLCRIAARAGVPVFLNGKEWLATTAEGRGTAETATDTFVSMVERDRTTGGFETQIAGSRVRVLRGDITTTSGDVIVNAANPSLLGGGGVDGAIHRAAGPALLEECRRIGGCAIGEAVITGAGQLDARHVIHTVGPMWGDVDSERSDGLLASCYRRSIWLAVEAGCGSIVFPNISTGIYGYPLERAADVALGAVRSTLASKAGDALDEVVFVCFDQRNFELYASLLADGSPS